MRWQRLSMCVLSAAGVLAGCAPRAQPVEGVMTEERVMLEVAGVLGGGPVADPPGSIALFHPGDIAFVGDTLVVVDTGNDRVLQLDTALRVQRVIGRSGEGPGEFRRPVAVRPAPDGMVISELGNMRFTHVGRDGSFRATAPSRNAALTFAVAGDGRLYAPVYSMTDFVLRMAGDSVELFAPRVDTVRMTEEDFIRSELGPMIALTEGDYVHVFDGRSGMLHKYAPNGALRMRRRLPATLLDSLQDSAGQLVRALDPRGRGSAVVALTKALSVTADGELLLLLHAGRTCGLVIDPDSYRVRRIVVPEEADPDLGMLAGAGHATLRGSAIYALVSDSLIAFRLARRPVRGTG